MNAVPMSFEDSRRLTGPNRHFADCGAVLETCVDAPLAVETQVRWRAEIARARSLLGWAEAASDVRLMPKGASLALAAPIDQLFTATEVNEWAWQRAAFRNDGFHAPGHAAVDDEVSGLRTLQLHSASERNPALRAVQSEAAARQLPFYFDDDTLSIGDAVGSFRCAMTALPSIDVVPWTALRTIPKAMVTGSNGKTTSVRLLAAMCMACGWHVGHTCTDGLFVDGVIVEPGDYSGPAGARAILRRDDIDAAVLEAARGGMLRRGLAVTQADVALVTNVSAEHFGEYGIYDLDALADVKLSLARALHAKGALILNADDETLLQKAQQMERSIAWFALDDDHPQLRSQRALGATTCGVRDGRMLLTDAGAVHDLGTVASMPLTMQGQATYNIANLAGSALAAFKLGIAPEQIARVLANFGSRRSDNPGRLQIWQLGGVRVLVDYAHNPEGLQGFLRIAEHSRTSGRLGLLLGQAGNRDDADVRALADVAARHRPERIVLKDIEGYLRGREAGEVANILRAQLLSAGVSVATIAVVLDEVAAAHALIAWAREGDVVALPMHGTRARAAVCAALDALECSGWQPGQPLNAFNNSNTATRPTKV